MSPNGSNGLNNPRVFDHSNVSKLMDDTLRFKTGLIERNYKRTPCGSLPFAPKSTIQPFPRSEWSDRIKEKNEKKALLSRVWATGNSGERIPSLDQNGQGFCWAYSTGGALILIRARDNQAYVRFSPHAVACQIKNFRDEGGWCTLPLEHATKYGYPSDKYWPQQSMSRSNLTPEMKANAALHLCQEWDDLPENLPAKERFDIQMTYLLMDLPVITDLNWWGHSVFDLDPVEIEPGSFGTRKKNSWGEGWETNGEAVLREDKAVYDGAVVPRVIMASAA